MPNNEIRTIQLTKGYVAVVDVEDFGRVSQHKWYSQVVRRKDGSIRNVYAARNVGTTGNQKTLCLHRFLMDVTDPKIDVDHKNHDGLDNRKENLRICTRSQNQGNAKLRADNVAGIKGVHRHMASGKWQARIRKDGKERGLGYFDTPEEAALAYATAAREAFGEFANTGESNAE